MELGWNWQLLMPPGMEGGSDQHNWPKQQVGDSRCSWHRDRYSHQLPPIANQPSCYPLQNISPKAGDSIPARGGSSASANTFCSIFFKIPMGPICPNDPSTVVGSDPSAS